jgi:DNA invertase Pin-like site-specific DNA recombinase
MSTCIICARISSEDQRQNKSLETQFKRCRKYAAEHGFTVVVEFSDVITGTTLDRPGFNEAKKLVGKVDAIIFHVQDRFSRGDILDTAQQMRWFQDHGTPVHITDKGQIDAYDDEQLEEIIQDAIAAQKERKNIVRRTSDGNRERVENDKVHGKAIPKYGYNYDAKAGKWVKNAKEAPWAIKIFEWHAYESLGITAIAKRLEDNRVPTKFDNLGKTKPSGAGRCKWNKGSVSKILKDPIYKGVWRYGRNNTDKPPLSLPTQALVSDELWEAAQQVSRTNQKEGNKGGQKYPALLQGRLTCSQCGRPFAQEHGRYGCYGQWASYSADGKSRPCSGSFDLLALDDQVWNALTEELQKPEKTIAGYQKRQRKREADLQPDREYLENTKADLARLDEKRLSYIHLYDNPRWTAEMINHEVDKVDADRQACIDKIAELEERLAKAELDAMSVEAFRDFCERVSKNMDSATPEKRRKIIEALDLKATIHRGPTVKVGHKRCGTGKLTATGLIHLDIAIQPGSESTNLTPEVCSQQPACGQLYRTLRLSNILSQP